MGSTQSTVLDSAVVLKNHSGANVRWSPKRASGRNGNGKPKLNRAFQRDMEQAWEAQAQLLPQETAIDSLDVSVKLWPCHWVAGDYADVVPTNDGRVLLAVADVSGKAMQGAIVASAIHAIVRASVSDGSGPTELMAKLNAHLCRFLPESSFVTMATVAIDPATGRTECANAGHPTPVVVAADGNQRLLVEHHTLPLGIGPMAFACEHDRLQHGQVLAMFTDGLTDLNALSGEPLGPSGLSQVLADVYASDSHQPTRTIGDRLASALEAVQGSDPPHDDRTLLLARRWPAPLKSDGAMPLEPVAAMAAC